MRELLPRVSRVGVLINVTNPLHVPQWRETQTAAGRAGIDLVSFEIEEADQLEDAFAALAGKQVDAVLVPGDLTFNMYYRRIADLGLSRRLPAIYFNRVQAENGGLISYGPDIVASRLVVVSILSKDRAQKRR
jgi:putative tryptophan/tyrosine transport system substrate-binding protein